MSRARVIVGRTHDGRPVSRWADTVAEPAAYGFMQPAYSTTVTRRQATPAELAAADSEPRGYLDAKPGRRQSTGPVGGWDGMASAERMQQSRARGAARTHESAQRTWNGTGLSITAADKIVHEVARAHGVSVAGLLSKARPVHLVDARAEAARRLFHEHPEMRLREIGEVLGGRDHSTVHALIRRAVR